MIALTSCLIPVEALHDRECVCDDYKRDPNEPVAQTNSHKQCSEISQNVIKELVLEGEQIENSSLMNIIDDSFSL